ncbi:MAG TPA: protein kinase [Thermoanaerobaculia bacterium]|nr:protein kinase [Thermoanaerobaculia bacterium]
MPLPPGTPLGPYEVRELLGKGGMGEVYRARDRRLDRDVAVKVISDEIASDSSARTRFEREAKAIAALSHPNILAIFDFSKDQDHWYAVTELLQGETLRERLRRGKLDPREATEIAVAVSGGLAAAHERGIVHRDLKPENVFLTRDGTVKILDFGLALVRKAPTEEEKTAVLATKAGQIVGTVTCMSPEQIRGETVDAATDIFAVGCLLYESIASRRPFCGENTLEVIAAVLKDEPDPLPPDVPPDLARIIMRCLKKDPAARFASALDLRAALQSPLPQGEGGPKDRVRGATRIIVLPFRMLRADTDLDFLSYSLPDAIVGSLAGLGSLVVRSSLSASQYAGAPLDIARIAAEQDVNAIVSGTILASGGRLRVSAQLTEMPGATVKWSHSTETSLDDIFGVQDELTRKIVRSLAGPTTDSDSRALRKDVPQSALAYEFFLRANQQAHLPSAWMVARDLYQRSIDEDPKFAPAWARLGRMLWLIAKYTDAPGDNWNDAEGALRKALELNPDLSLAHRYYAEIEIEGEHTIESLRRLKDRVKVRPNDPELRAALGKALRYTGLLHESLGEFEKVSQLDPKMPTSVAHTHFMLGDYERAQATIKSDIFYLRPLTLAMLGRQQDAERLLREALKSDPDPQYSAYHRALLGTLQGDREFALPGIEKIVTHNRDPEAWFYQVRSLARLGDREEALNQLERVSRSFFPIYTFEHDPWLEPLRESPRFAEILRGAKERHEAARSVW